MGQRIAGCFRSGAGEIDYLVPAFGYDAYIVGRLGLLKVLHIKQEVIYSKCREFQSGSFVISHLKSR